MVNNILVTSYHCLTSIQSTLSEFSFNVKHCEHHLDQTSSLIISARPRLAVIMMVVRRSLSRRSLLVDHGDRHIGLLAIARGMRHGARSLLVVAVGEVAVAVWAPTPGEGVAEADLAEDEPRVEDAERGGLDCVGCREEW